ncbi:MAG TPA: hypothetical protein VFO91_13415 [Anaerolineales bacterium]|nr:hypothetical protein [Anaerolineales bacterium]
MNALYTPRLQGRKKESLQTQHEFLNLLRLRHLHWMNSTDNPDIEQLHEEIAALIHKTTDRYHHLLDALHEQEREEPRLYPVRQRVPDVVKWNR